MRRLSIALWSALGVSLGTGCITVRVPQLNDPEKLGKQISTGALAGVQEQGEAAAQKVVAGAGKSLREDVLNDETNAKLKKTVGDGADALVERLHTVLGQVNALLASLGKRSQEVGRQLSQSLGQGLQDDVLGPQTEQRVAALAAQLRNQLIGDEANRQVAALGKTLGEAVNQMLINAQQRLNQSTEQLQAKVDQEQKKFRNALIAAVVVLILGLCATGLLHYELQKHRRLVDVLASHIEKIPDQRIYDEVVKPIESDAIAAGVNEDLRKRLRRQGFLEKWAPPSSGG